MLANSTTSSKRSSTSRGLRPRASPPSTMLRSPDSSLIRAALTPRSEAVPSAQIRPPEVGITPAIARSRVDLPEPLWPMIPIDWPWWATNEMPLTRSEEHTSELQSLMRTSYAVFCLKKKNINNIIMYEHHNRQQDITM